MADNLNSYQKDLVRKLKLGADIVPAKLSGYWCGHGKAYVLRVQGYYSHALRKSTFQALLKADVVKADGQGVYKYNVQKGSGDE